MQWTLRTHDSDVIQSIERGAKVSPVLAQILALRGIIQPQQVASFLDSKLTGLYPPEQLPGVVKACEIIAAAIKNKQKIVIYGDYDCDGMTGTAILYGCCQLLGGKVAYHIPSRLKDGYGLGVEPLQKLFDQGADLIVTVDCGIANVEAVAFAKQAGKQIIVTDHHQFGPQLPRADAIVHPNLPDASYPFTGLCGAGVAFKLAWALCTHHHGTQKLPPAMRDFLFRAISLAAIGTVADVVPLLDENRIIVHAGMRCFREFASPGLAELTRLAKCWDKPTLEAEDIAFSIGPRLNAAGRLGHARLGVELLICEDEKRSLELAAFIDGLNKDRDKLDRDILHKANKLIEQNFDPQSDSALVLAGPDWHLGVIGIVAGRIASKHHRPTVLISTDSFDQRAGIGSCRTSGGVNLYQALANCQDYLQSFGGHAAAAGLRIDPAQIDLFRDAFLEQVQEQVAVADMAPNLLIDAETLIGNLTAATMNELTKLGPFGEGNPRPVLCATGVRLVESPKPIGDGRHLSMNLVQHNSRIRAVAFGKADWLNDLSVAEGVYDFAFRPVFNEFRGFKSVELQLIDFRASQRI